MTKTRLASLISTLLLWGGSVSATTTQHTIYFTAPTEGKVFKIKVDVDEMLRAVVSLQITELLPTLPYGSTPKDVAFGPDGNLYIILALNNEICMMPEVGGTCTTFYTPGPATALGGMRFLGNDLYFTAAQGIFRKNISESTPTAAVQVTTQALTARGMTVSLTGDLIPLNGTSMFRVQRASTSAFNTTGQVLNLNGFFSATKGVAAEPVTQINPTTGQVIKSNRKFVTGTKSGDGEAVAVFTCPSPPGTNCTLQTLLTHTLDSGDEARDIEIDLKGSSFFATQNGKLFRFDPDASFSRAILLADLPLELEDTISGHGVALPPTSRTDTAVFGGAGTKTLNCGNSLVAITVASPATANITCQMDLPGEPPCPPAQGINCQFVGEATDALCTQYDWNGGFCTLMSIPDNMLPPSTEFSVAYIKKDEPLNAQPLIVHESTDVTITNYFLAGALAPEDQTRGGRGFSTNVLADRPIPIEDFGTFVGFKGKLSTNRNSPTLVNNEIPVRPQFDHSPRSGETLQLSANCFDPLVFINPVRSVGNANDENFFRPAGNHWQFNLDLSNFPKNKLCVLSIWGNVGQFVEAFIKRK